MVEAEGYLFLPFKAMVTVHTPTEQNKEVNDLKLKRA
jgi:hypothetical protein